MIKSFANQGTDDIYHGIDSKAAHKYPSEIHDRSADRMVLLAAATVLKDLLKNPGNHLEKLKGDLADKYSIRVNRQWRITFDWNQGNAYQVNLVDYH